MKQIVLFLSLFFSVTNLNAQEIKFRENIDKDSLLNVSVHKLPENMREEYIRTYKEENEQTKEFLLFTISMPESSKKELIENFEIKKSEIKNLKTEYRKIVPKNYIVEIEFEAESKILTIPEQITIKIYKLKNDNAKESETESHVVQRSGKYETVSENWNLKPNSEELEKVIKTIGWKNQTLTDIRKLLSDANCISIKNGENTTIGFARSGMGKYSYKIFEKPLNSREKEEYNNGCEYIFYKDNIVLEYGGGAVGPQCFERE